MIRTQNTAINASSMADIAFLLLIFFMVTTTMEEEIGIQSILPTIDSKEESHRSDINTLEISINGSGQILIEKAISSKTEIKSAVRLFFSGDQGQPELISFEEKSLKSKLEGDQGTSLDKWRLKTAQLMGGEYQTLPEDAIIAIETNSEVAYKDYIFVQDEIRKSIMELRREWCSRNFNRPYESLNPRNADDKAILRAARLIYPIRIQDVNFV